MQLTGVSSPQEVINIGDTPSDLQSGLKAGCLLSLEVTNGTHTRAQLEEYPNDGLLDDLGEMLQILKLYLK